MMLEDQKLDLHEKISSKDETIISLKQECKGLRDHLSKTEEKLSQQENSLNDQAANLEELRVQEDHSVIHYRC